MLNHNIDHQSCNILELQTRRDIYEHIASFPGQHIRMISRTLQIPFSTLQYHLRYLEKRELIIGKNDGKYTRYYSRFQFGKKEKEIVNILRKKTTRSIVFYLLAFVVCSQAELSKSLEKHPTTIKFHVNNMEKNFILKRVKSEYGIIKFDYKPYELEHMQEGNEILYALNDPYLIYNILITNRKSLLEDDMFQHMLDYINYMISTGVPDKMASPRKAIDVLVDLFWDLFPPSFMA